MRNRPSQLLKRLRRYLLRMLMSRIATSLSWCLATIPVSSEKLWRDVIGGSRYLQYIQCITSNGNRCHTVLSLKDWVPSVMLNKENGALLVTKHLITGTVGMHLDLPRMGWVPSTLSKWSITLSFITLFQKKLHCSMKSKSSAMA